MFTSENDLEISRVDGAFAGKYFVYKDCKQAFPAIDSFFLKVCSLLVILLYYH